MSQIIKKNESYVLIQEFVNDTALEEYSKKSSVTIKLNIDLEEDSLSITPPIGLHFKFEGPCYKVNQWRATLKVMDDAIEFADNALKFNSKLIEATEGKKQSKTKDNEKK